MTEQDTRAEPAAAPPGPRLARHRERKVIAGVCEGAGRYFGIDPVVFRIVLGVLALTGGLGLVAYGLAWLLVPLEGESASEAHRLLSGRVEGTALTAVLVALVGCGLFLSTLGSGGNLTFSLALLAAFAGAVYWSVHRRQATEAPAQPVAPPPTQPPPQPAAAAWWKETAVEDAPSAPGPGGYLWGPDDGPADEERDRREWRERRRAVRREGAWLGGLVFCLAAAAAAGGLAASWSAQPLATSVQIALGSALAVFGLGFVVSTWWGRLGGGTVVMVLLTAALLVGSTTLPPSVGTDWQQRTWTPTTLATVRDSYELGAGRATLDLSRLQPGGRTVSTRAQVGAGQLVVRIPQDVALRMHVQVGVGDLKLPGDKDQDIDVRPGLDRKVALAPVDGRKPVGTLELDVEVGVGQVKVVQSP
ncbi:PspC domain-containing protein [Actinacidiphila sp. bgisy167]|uniref:PspC domain-containing protein n=1 Tax=Actinacidiphila sp. bgisy167 TaxID=3413797 RepID=UPI003D70B24E